MTPDGEYAASNAWSYVLCSRIALLVPPVGGELDSLLPRPAETARIGRPLILRASYPRANIAPELSSAQGDESLLEVWHRRIVEFREANRDATGEDVAVYPNINRSSSMRAPNTI